MSRVGRGSSECSLIFDGEFLFLLNSALSHFEERKKQEKLKYEKLKGPSINNVCHAFILLKVVTKPFTLSLQEYDVNGERPQSTLTLKSSYDLQFKLIKFRNFFLNQQELKDSINLPAVFNLIALIRKRAW